MALSLSSVTSTFSSLFQNATLVSHYLGEIMQAGPDAFRAITDLLRAINDLRTGKIDPDDFTAIVDDFKKLWMDFTTAAPAAAGTTTVVTTTTAAAGP